jgi:hypothetical protein
MMRAFLKMAALFVGGWAAASLPGCAGKATAVKPDAVARKPAPQAGADGKAKGPSAKVGRPDKADAGKPADRGSGPTAERFRFPDDRAGRLLAEMLLPHRQTPSGPAGDFTTPPRPAGLVAVEVPDWPLPPAQVETSRPRIEPPAREARPRLAGEAPPLEWARFSPRAPARQELPSAARVRLPSPDLSRPLPLPVLAQPLPDRAPVTDPTAEASRSAALAGKVPPAALAPFLRLNLPDPFEHRHEIRLRKPPKEDEMPFGQGSGAPPK